MSDPAFDIGKFVQETADTHRRLIQQGIDIGEGRYNTTIQALEAAYRRAMLNPDAKIPTYLEAAIFVLIGMNIAMPKGDTSGDYAEHMIRKDQLERHEGRPEHDMTTRSTPLKGAP